MSKFSVRTFNETTTGWFEGLDKGDACCVGFSNFITRPSPRCWRRKWNIFFRYSSKSRTRPAGTESAYVFCEFRLIETFKSGRPDRTESSASHCSRVLPRFRATRSQREVDFFSATVRKSTVGGKHFLLFSIQPAVGYRVSRTGFARARPERPPGLARVDCRRVPPPVLYP